MHDDPDGPSPMPVLLAWAGLVWAVGAAVFFRQWWWSGFDLVIGDRGDGRFIAYILEHWRIALAGGGSWTSPPMYFPLAGGLGRSDALFAFLPFYLPLRWAGLDIWAAFPWTFVATGLVGFLSATVLVHRLWRLPLWAALAGAYLFAFPNNMFIQANHAQMFAVHFIAPLLIAASLAVAWRRERPVAAAAAAVCLGAGEALLLFTSYYTGWFFGVACLVFALAVVALERGRVRRAIRDDVLAWTRLCLGAASGFGVAIVPFLIVYLPIVWHEPGNSYPGMVSLMGGLRDIWNVGPNNLIWGGLLDALGPRVTPNLYSWEHALLVTPLLGLFYCASVAVVAWRPDLLPARFRTPVLAAFAATTVLLLLTLHIDTVSLWKGVRAVVPGASALRALMRAHLVSSAVIALAAPVFLALAHRALARRMQPRLALAVLLGVAALFAVEQINTGTIARISRSEERARFDSVPPPPRNCAAFFATVADPDRRPYYEIQIDAMLVSLKVGLPTLNGYTGKWPEYWTMVHPGGDDYPAAVADWIERNAIDETLCVLDMGGLTWKRHPPR